jgi:hypothetical protein
MKLAFILSNPISVFALLDVVLGGGSPTRTERQKEVKRTNVCDGVGIEKGRCYERQQC